jgi:hypothetical protein
LFLLGYTVLPLYLFVCPPFLAPYLFAALSHVCILLSVSSPLSLPHSCINPVSPVIFLP